MKKENENQTAVNLALSTANTTAGIMKELSDIKANLATNTEKTTNIGQIVNEIKQEQKEARNIYVSITDYNVNHKTLADIQSDHEKRIRFVEKAIWWGFGALAVLQVVLKIYKP